MLCTNTVYYVKPILFSMKKFVIQFCFYRTVSPYQLYDNGTWRSLKILVDQSRLTQYFDKDYKISGQII